jgi:hypothetical protein
LFTIFAIYRLIVIFISYFSKTLPADDGSQKFLDAANYNVRAGPRVLVLRGVYDEAALALTIGSGLAVLSRVFRKQLFRDIINYILIGAAIVVLPSIAIYVTSMFPGWPETDSSARDLEYVFVDVPLTIGILLLILRGVESLGRSFFGRGMAFTSGTLELDVSPTPDCRENVEVHTLPPEPQEKRKALRHVIYARTDTAPCISEWLKDK